MTVEERLEKIEELLTVLVDRQMIKEWYTVEEFARSVGKTPWTIREWCRHGRIHAERRLSGRGQHLPWVISHEELLRYQHEGLLPIRRPNGLPFAVSWGRDADSDDAAPRSDGRRIHQ